MLEYARNVSNHLFLCRSRANVCHTISTIMAMLIAILAPRKDAPLTTAVQPTIRAASCYINPNKLHTRTS